MYFGALVFVTTMLVFTAKKGDLETIEQPLAALDLEQMHGLVKLTKFNSQKKNKVK